MNNNYNNNLSRVIHDIFFLIPYVNSIHSQAVQVDKLLFISGSIGFDVTTQAMAPGGVVPETEQVRILICINLKMLFSITNVYHNERNNTSFNVLCNLYYQNLVSQHNRTNSQMFPSS